MLILQMGLDRDVRLSMTLDKIKKACEADKRIFVLVPEQNNFSMSKTIFSAVGNSLANGRVDVVGFKQFVDRVYSNCGGRKASLDDGGRLLVMALAVNTVKKDLSIYKSSAARSEFLSNLLATYTMMKLHGVDHSALKNAAGEMEDSVLGTKLDDIAKIFEAYSDICASGKLDPAEDIDSANSILAASDWLKGTVWFVDGYSMFPQQQLALLTTILRHADTVVVNIAADGFEDIKDSSKLPVATATKLVSIAKENGIPYKKVHIKSDARALTALDFLQKNLCDSIAAKPVAVPGVEKNIEIFCDPTPYQELQHVAGEILRAIREGYRYKDITVALCEYDKYAPVMDTICRRYEIPAYFSSSKEDIGRKPIMQAINSALNAATRGMQKEDVLQYLKSGVSNLSYDEVDMLENYVRAWNIHGRGWAPESGAWTMHPDGYGREFDASATEELKIINETRLKGISPLLKLKSALAEAATLGAYVEALYDFLEDIDFTAHLQEIVDSMIEIGETQLAMEYGQVSEVICGAMEQMHETVGTLERTPVEFVKLFKLLCSSYEIATIPAALDQVEVSSVEDARFTTSKLRYIVGATEGHFPEYSAGDALLSSHDIAMLKEYAEIELPGTDEDIATRGMSDISSVIGGAEEKLVLSYPCNPAAPETPSHLITRTQQFFPMIEAKSGAQIGAIYSADLLTPKMVGRLVGRVTNRPKYEYVKWSLSTIDNRIVQDTAWEMLDKAAWDIGKVSRTSVKGLYGERIPLTATRAEAYSSCRYYYFLKYGLGVKEPSTGKMTSPVFGTFAHAVIEKTMSEVEREYGGFKNIESIDVLDSITRKHIAEYTAEKMKGLEDQPERYIYMYKRNCRELVTILRNICAEFSVSDFRATQHEFRIGGESPDMPALPIVGKDAKGNYIGVADRIDTCTLHDGETFFRVTDYKTGRSQTMDMSNILAGKSLQLIMYLAAVREHLKKRVEGGAAPAALLYTPAKEIVIASHTKLPPDKVAAEREKELRRRGFVLDDPEVIHAMEHMDGPNAKFLPVRIKDGKAIGDDLCTKEQLDMLEKYTRLKMGEMVDGIASGEVFPNPVSRGMDRTSCSYCPYKAVCHKDACGVKYKYQAQVSKEEFWTEIERSAKS